MSEAVQHENDGWIFTFYQMSRKIILSLWPVSGKICLQLSLLRVSGMYCTELVPPTHITVTQFTLSPKTSITVL